MDEVKREFLIIISLILIVAFCGGLLWKLIIISDPEANYSCEVLNQTLLEGSCLVKSRTFLFYSCYDMNDVYINYKFRCR